MISVIILDGLNHYHPLDLFSGNLIIKKIFENLIFAEIFTQLSVNPCPVEPGYTLPLQTV